MKKINKVIKNNKKLFLIDAFPFIYKSFYAHKKKHLITSNGINTSSIVGFTHFILKILNIENPNYMAVIFDGKNNFRKLKYRKYKLNRKKTPQEINDSIPYLLSILKAFKIITYHANNGYEADDVIGTIAKLAENKGYIVYIISTDKDFFQLVTKNIKIYCMHKKHGKKILGINYVNNKFNIDNPKKILDFWAMIGDKSDNIPGLPGIGEKLAKKFLKKYGNIENFLNSTSDLKGKMKKNIEKYKELGLLYKKLVTIVTNIPNVNFIEQDCYIKKPYWNEIENIFNKLELNKLLIIYHNYFIKKYNI